MLSLRGVVRLSGVTSSRRSLHGTSAAAAASGTKKSVSSRDTRLAGRLRFYKEVGVTGPISAPWEVKEDAGPAVPSPVSAGVDGTDSASGVHRMPDDHGDKLRAMLAPRGADVPWFGVTLDGKVLKTPMGQTLALPSQNLAYAVAAEWNAQLKYLQPSQMPLMTMACTALDQAALHPEEYQKEALKYLLTDTTCFWADPTEDRVLHHRQSQAWTKLHEFVERRCDHSPVKAIGIHEGMLLPRRGGLPHPTPLIDHATSFCEGLDAWHLVALNAACAQAKSFMVGMALLENDEDSPFSGNVDAAIEASRVEEEFQISNWGLVEGGHDYDRLNCSVQLYSARFMTRCILVDNNL